MKKICIVITLLAGAVSGYSQGQLVFNLYSSDLQLAVFNSPSIAAATYFVSYAGSAIVEEVGNTSANTEMPKGTTVYASEGLSGTGYDIELLAGPAGITFPGGIAGGVGLTPVSSIFHFKTGLATVGIMNGSETVTLPKEYYFDGTSVSIAIAAWDNEGGTINSLAAAVEGNTGFGFVPWGISPVVQTSVLSVTPNPPTALPIDLESFSLAWSDTPPPIPEPRITELGILGVSLVMVVRRGRE